MVKMVNFILYVFYYNFLVERFKIPTAKDHFENSKYSKILSRTEEYLCKSEKTIVRQPEKSDSLNFTLLLLED